MPNEIIKKKKPFYQVFIEVKEVTEDENQDERLENIMGFYVDLGSLEKMKAFVQPLLNDERAYVDEVDNDSEAVHSLNF